MHAIDRNFPTFRWTPAQLADTARHRTRTTPDYLPAEALAPRFRVS